VKRPDPALLVQAASCYRRLGLLTEAARCFREAGDYLRAAELHRDLGRYRDAAHDYAQAGHPDLAGWLLVHDIGSPAAARDQLARPAAVAVPALRRKLVEARCDVAEERAPRAALETVAEACHALADPALEADPLVERWAVDVAEALRREDRVALVFAAAVRGGRSGAEDRWRAWMNEVLHAELVLPDSSPAA
jgi:hypothetical protein